eukprot:c3735_g1_i3.p1 GENE.c3735_g1_i3~~c3735_g1_i3.p1  ORF type:complete len:180 (-),score=17.36 c3735_g1_i3:121-660(-)
MLPNKPSPRFAGAGGDSHLRRLRTESQMGLKRLTRSSDPSLRLPNTRTGSFRIKSEEPAQQLLFNDSTVINGLFIQKLENGDGINFPRVGQRVKLHYTTKLLNGKTVFSSRDSGVPWHVVCESDDLIKGISIVLKLMSVGDRIMVTVPPELAYGHHGSPPTVPPFSTLIIDLELVSILS